MGFPEQPVTRRMIRGKLRRYKCRVCGRIFKDYYLPEEKRVCARCTEAELGDGKRAVGNNGMA